MFSNLTFNLLGSSSHDKVNASSLPPHRRTFAKLDIETPKVICLSHLYSSKPSEDKLNVTSATWELSIAWREIPMGDISKFISETKSLILSINFLINNPSFNLA